MMAGSASLTPTSLFLVCFICSALQLPAADCNGNGVADQIDTTVKHLAFQPTVFPVGKNPVSMVAGDLDGDGDNDLAVANKDSNDISVLLNGPGSLFSPGGSFKVAKGPVSLVARDLNGDGDLDLA